MRLLVVLLTLALAAAAVCQEETLMFTVLPENPHRSFHVEGECQACHDTYLKEVDPHVFIIPITEMCLRESCHTVQKLGRSHPVGVDARLSKQIEAVPEHIPLEGDLVSCGSCHQPHGEWLSSSRCYKGQAAKGFLVETVGGEQRLTPYFTTYYLRVPGDPMEGFTPLCNSCHQR